MPRTQPKSRQATLLQRAEFAAFRGFECLLGLTSIGSAVRLGRMLGRLFHALNPRYRSLVRRNLRIATADSPPSPAELDALVRETFRRAGANFLAALRSPTLTPDELRRITIAEGLEHVQSDPSGPRGTVVALPHMGNWEILSRLGKSLVGGGQRYGGIYRPLDNPLMDGITRQRRTADGAELFSRKDGFHAPAALLREGGALAVLSDQRAGARGVAIPFFGKMTTCPPLPELLARRCHARAAILAIVTDSPGRWRMSFRPIGEEPSTAAVMLALEKAIRTSLPDVFWFHDRWRTDRARPLSLFTVIDPDEAARASVPLRMLVTLPPGLDVETTRAFLERLLLARPDLRIEWLTSAPAGIPHPRIVNHVWDPAQPHEHADSTLRRLDESHPAPLDGALLFGAEAGLARACRRIGLRAIIGLEVAGKPWSRSFPTPAEPAAWLEIADELARVPESQRQRR